MMKCRYLLAILTLFALPDTSFAQCCSAGNPSSFSYNDQGLLKARSLFVSSSLRYGYSGKYYSGDKAATMNFKAPANFSFVDLRIAYGMSKRFTIQAETGYFLAKVQHNPYPNPPDRGYGLGDASFGLRYRAFKSTKHKIELNTSAGMRLPVGVFDQEVDGVKLPLSIQPSSGSLVYLGGATLSKTLSNNKLHIYSSIFAEFPQLIDSKNFYYRYGNLYNLSVSVSYPVYKLFKPALQLQGEMRSRATRENDQLVDASGYKVLFVTPMIECNALRNFSVLWYADLPVYRYFNGIQLANSFKTGIRFAYSFNI